MGYKGNEPRPGKMQAALGCGHAGQHRLHGQVLGLGGHPGGELLPPDAITSGAPGVRGGQRPPERVLTSRIHPTTKSWTWERETQTLEVDLRLL